MDAIKKAFREKALDAHPDKNRGVDPEKANEQFIRVKKAWDLLSDQNKKRQYDDHIRHHHNDVPRTPTKERLERQARMRRKADDEARMKREAEERKTGAKIAQRDILKLSTLEQLQGMSDLFDKESQTFKKFFLCVFVADKKVESMADNDILFPYPYGHNGRDSFDWTEIMQTVKVRYNKATPLTRLFRAPIRSSPKPYIVFAKKGARLDRAEFEIYNGKYYKNNPGKNSAEFEQWVMSRLKTTISVINRYGAGGPILKVFFDHGEMLKSAGRTIPPGFQLDIPAFLSNRMIVVDGNTDNFMGNKGLLENVLHGNKRLINRIKMDTFVVNEDKQRFEVGAGYGSTSICYDLSTQCQEWVEANYCDSNSNIFHNMCAKSCGVCIESFYWNGIHYALLHMPLYKIPNILGLRTIVSLFRSIFSFFFHDVSHLWNKRRNVMFGFFFTGLLLGIQIVLLAQMFIAKDARVIRRYGASSGLISLGLLLLSTSITIGAKFWLSVTSKRQIPKILWAFQRDLQKMELLSTDLIYVLFGLGIISSLLSSLLTQRLKSHPILRQTILLVTIVLVTATMAVGTGYYLYFERGGGPSEMHRYNRWNHICRFSKNVAASIIISGNLFGALLVGIGKYAKQLMQPWYLVLSIANIGLWSGLLCLAFYLDRFFYEDLKHTLEMRMSAAIPCLVFGMIWGFSGAYFICTHRIKAKVD
uniref:J domain-containing protein n=1 Tax=Pseudo-nitzschia australis TaxID=44445 RepID=A0A7S4AB29_9STRA